jgi:hypothetical protein
MRSNVASPALLFCSVSVALPGLKKHVVLATQGCTLGYQLLPFQG